MHISVKTTLFTSCLWIAFLYLENQGVPIRLGLLENGNDHKFRCLGSEPFLDRALIILLLIYLFIYLLLLFIVAGNYLTKLFRALLGMSRVRLLFNSAVFTVKSSVLCARFFRFKGWLEIEIIICFYFFIFYYFYFYLFIFTLSGPTVTQKNQTEYHQLIFQTGS